MARYITTTLPYVNADPHIGHALEFVQADFLARHWREGGEEVFFNTGTDEHGQKIFEAAKGAGQEVQDYVDHYAGEFRKQTLGGVNQRIDVQVFNALPSKIQKEILGKGKVLHERAHSRQG